MSDLSAFPITKRWPAKHPDRLQLYSLPTPNGVKVSIMLEEIGLPYEVHLVDFGKDDQKTPEFLSLNPNGKIPAILDPDGPGGKPLGLFESGAILQYLAEKTGKLLPADAARRWQTIQWVHFQMGGIGPMFGQVGFFHKFAGKEFADKRPLERYVAESKRLLGVLETHLGGRQWVMDDEYTIADISMLGWVRNLIGFYGARELVAFDSLQARAGMAGARPRAACRGARPEHSEAAVSNWMFRNALSKSGRLTSLNSLRVKCLSRGPMAGRSQSLGDKAIHQLLQRHVVVGKVTACSDGDSRPVEGRREDIGHGDERDFRRGAHRRFQTIQQSSAAMFGIDGIHGFETQNGGRLDQDQTCSSFLLHRAQVR